MISLIIKVYQFKVWETLKYCERKGELHAKSLTEPVVLHEYQRHTSYLLVSCWKGDASRRRSQMGNNYYHPSPYSFTGGYDGLPCMSITNNTWLHRVPASGNTTLCVKAKSSLCISKNLLRVTTMLTASDKDSPSEWKGTRKQRL